MFPLGHKSSEAYLRRHLGRVVVTNTASDSHLARKGSPLYEENIQLEITPLLKLFTVFLNHNKTN